MLSIMVACATDLMLTKSWAPQENVRLGKKLATGGFGTVYRADLVDDESGDVRAVIVKKVWQTRRARCPAHGCAHACSL